MSQSSSNGGVGVVGLLGVAFVVLKLTGFIAWSWWWVLAPFWIPLAMWAAIMAVAGLLFLYAWIEDTRAAKAARAARRAGAGVGSGGTGHATGGTRPKPRVE